MEAIIIVGGGQGVRFGGDTPKQFITVNGKPLFFHTLTKFVNYNPNMQFILVVPKDTTDTVIAEYASLAQNELNVSLQIIRGGDSRFQSVREGLSLLKPNVTFVGVHDAVRPLVSNDTIQRCFKTAAVEGSAVPVVAIEQSIREIYPDGSSQAKDRKKYKFVQTPQCFTKEWLEESYQQEELELFTDDASVVEHQGYTIKMVEGNPENIKITTPPDLKYAEVFL